jgi:hypothetical protein
MDSSYNAESYRELEGHRLFITESMGRQSREEEIEMELRQFTEKMAEVIKCHDVELKEENLRRTELLARHEFEKKK